MTFDELEKRIEYLEKQTGYKYDPNPRYEQSHLTFDDVLNLVNDRSLQHIFREVDDSTLAGVIYSLETPEQMSKIKKNLSANHFERLIDNIKDGYYGTLPERLTRYREEFMKTIRQLEQMGEIVIARADESYVEGFFDGEIKEETLEEKEKRAKRWEEYKEEKRKEREWQKNKIQEWLDKMGIK